MQSGRASVTGSNLIDTTMWHLSLCFNNEVNHFSLVTLARWDCIPTLEHGNEENEEIAVAQQQQLK
jgi:hypothetical protein